jgi:tetratricopeptide (TPR) repeat protein
MEPNQANPVPKQTRLEFLVAIAAHWTIVAAVGGLVWAAGYHGIEWYWYGKSPFAAAEDWRETRRMVCMHLDIADTLLDSGLIAQAQGEYQSALELDATNIHARRGLLKTAIFEPIEGKEYDPGASRIRLDQLRRSDPSDPHVDLYLGHLLVDADPTAAESHYYEAIRKAANRPTCDPGAPRSELADAHNGLGQIFLTQRRFPEAAAEYKRAADLSQANPAPLENFAYAAMLSQDYAGSEEASRKAIILNANNLISYFTHTMASLLTGQVELASWSNTELLQRLETGKLRLKTNAGAWGFHSERYGMVWLQTDSEKTAYAHLLAGIVAVAELDHDSASAAFSASARAAGPISADAQFVDDIFETDLSRYAAVESGAVDALAARSLWQEALAKTSTP